MNDYITLYYIYTHIAVRILRWILFIVLGILGAVSVLHGHFPKLPLFFLSLVLLIEVFFEEVIIHHLPTILIKNNDGSYLYDSATLQMLELFFFQDTTSHIIKKLIRLQSVSFMLQKSDILPSEISFIDISKDQLLQTAYEIAKNMNGKYITTIDLAAAYFLLTEPQTKLLFSKNLKDTEFMHIVYWTRADFPKEEIHPKAYVSSWGEGIGEGWVSGWTYETKNYITDLTSSVISEQPVLIGREKEYTQFVEILSKPTKNNVILIGDPGVGKTTLLKMVAYDSFLGKIKGNIYHKRFYELMIGPLIAGVSSAGDLEARLQPIMEEVSHAGNLILVIPQIENIVGSATFHLDLSGALFPYLRDGNIRVVATITDSAYKTFIESKASFNDVFETVHLEEPDAEETIQMLLEKAHEVEKKNGVALTYKAIIAASNLSKRFNPDHALPGAALSLLDHVASSIVFKKKFIVEEKDVITVVEQQTHIAIAAPTGEEKDLLLHIEDKLHERVVGQQEAISAIGEALRRIRSGLTSQTRPISFLFLGPTGVGKTETAKALSSLYFHGEDTMIRLDMSEYSGNDALKRLLGAAPGEGEARGELTEKVREHPFSLVLLDEFEKANPEVHNLFLQILDDGRLTDNQGKTIAFVNTIIIATSNAGSEFIREELAKGTTALKDFQKKLLDLLQTKAIFKPELLNRFDEIIAFKPLGEPEVQQITKLLLQGVSKKLFEQDIIVTFDDMVIAKIAKEGFDQEFGARPLRRFIDHNIEDMLAQKILRNELQRGAKITVSVDQQGNIIVIPT